MTQNKSFNQTANRAGEEYEDECEDAYDEEREYEEACEREEEREREEEMRRYELGKREREALLGYDEPEDRIMEDSEFVGSYDNWLREIAEGGDCGVHEGRYYDYFGNEI